MPSVHSISASGCGRTAEGVGVSGELGSRGGNQSLEAKVAHRFKPRSARSCSKVDLPRAPLAGDTPIEPLEKILITHTAVVSPVAHLVDGREGSGECVPLAAAPSLCVAVGG